MSLALGLISELGLAHLALAEQPESIISFPDSNIEQVLQGAIDNQLLLLSFAGTFGLTKLFVEATLRKKTSTPIGAQTCNFPKRNCGPTDQQTNPLADRRGVMDKLLFPII